MQILYQCDALNTINVKIIVNIHLLDLQDDYHSPLLEGVKLDVYGVCLLNPYRQYPVLSVKQKLYLYNLH
jgi:hypothetical protein